MANIIISGHGGYATAVRRNLSMLTGMTEGMVFVDFNEGDDLDTLIASLKAAVEACGEEIAAKAVETTRNTVTRFPPDG